uniref:4Fe-4S Mo/W bis-MGD-type domain-containing protein n=1 Tax=Brugia timori TaxID=42155 RepID=A0A0R3QHZ1_9BILA
LIELLVGLGVADHAHERCQAGTGAEQVEALAGQRVVDEQRAGGLAAHDDGVAHLDVLQPRGQRAVFHLDAQELEVLLVVRAHDAVGAQQRLVVDAQADHREVAVGETQRRVARGGEGEQAVGPVVDAQDLLFAECTHTELNSGDATQTKAPAQADMRHVCCKPRHHDLQPTRGRPPMTEHTKTDGLPGMDVPVVAEAGPGGFGKAPLRNERMSAAKVECNACPVLCQISDGRTGACDRYANREGVLVRVDPVVLLRRQLASDAPALVAFDRPGAAADGSAAETAPAEWNGDLLHADE